MTASDSSWESKARLVHPGKCCPCLADVVNTVMQCRNANELKSSRHGRNADVSCVRDTCSETAEEQSQLLLECIRYDHVPLSSESTMAAVSAQSALTVSQY